MITLIKTQTELDNLIERTKMLGNIYFDAEMNYIPIDWNKEYIEKNTIDNRITLERIII